MIYSGVWEKERNGLKWQILKRCTHWHQNLLGASIRRWKVCNRIPWVPWVAVCLPEGPCLIRSLNYQQSKVQTKYQRSAIQSPNKKFEYSLIDNWKQELLESSGKIGYRPLKQIMTHPLSMDIVRIGPWSQSLKMLRNCLPETYIKLKSAYYENSCWALSRNACKSHVITRKIIHNKVLILLLICCGTFHTSLSIMVGSSDEGVRLN